MSVECKFCIIDANNSRQLKNPTLKIPNNFAKIQNYQFCIITYTNWKLLITVWFEITKKYKIFVVREKTKLVLRILLLKQYYQPQSRDKM